MIYLLGPRTPLPEYQRTTAEKLAELGQFIFINSLRDLPSSPRDSLIRYGVSSHPNEDLRFSQVFNLADNIRLASNKITASRWFLTHGINTPRIWVNRRRIPSDAFPVLSRRRYHTRGSDIRFIRDLIELRRVTGDYYVEFTPGNIEYRIHIFRNEVIRVSKKMTEGEERHIRNVENDYRFKDHFYHDVGIELSAMQEALKAVNVLGLDFGAVDVLIGEDGLPYILEVNTGPRLSRFGRELYLKYFSQYLDEDVSLVEYRRLRRNTGSFFNGLPITYRDIVKRNQRIFYE